MAASGLFPPGGKPSTSSMTLKTTRARCSRPQPLAVQALVDAGNELAVAVEQQRFAPLAGADDLFGRLAPARLRHRRIDVGPEAVFGGLQHFPHALRPLLDEGELDDRLDRLEAVFPRHRQPQRRAVLLGERMAVGAGGDEGEIVGRLRHGQALDIGPREPGLALARRDLRVLEGLHAQVFRRAERLGQIDQLLQREAGPGDSHAPGLDAAVAIGALFEPRLAHEVVDADLERLVDQAVDRHRPWPDRQHLRRAGDFLVGAEFIEIVVVRVDQFVGDGAVELVGVVALGRIEVGAGVRQLAEILDALRQRRARQGGERAGAGEQAAAAEHQVLRRDLGLRDLPAAAADDGHGECSLGIGSIDLRPSPPHRQVTTLSFRGGAQRRTRNPDASADSVSGFRLRAFGAPRNDVRYSAARRAATIWSAVRPVSSAMWSNLKVKEPTPAVAERTSMMRSPISASAIWARTTSQPGQPSRVSKPRIWPRRPDRMAFILAVASLGQTISTRWIGSSSTGLHCGRPSTMAMRPAVRNAMSEESTVW